VVGQAGEGVEVQAEVTDLQGVYKEGLKSYARVQVLIVGVVCVGQCARAQSLPNFHQPYSPLH
jgi:hypothetical protein